ncbi:MAG: carbohydrate ABC transporter permease [Thermomicrobiales bacterium]
MAQAVSSDSLSPLGTTTAIRSSRFRTAKEFATSYPYLIPVLFFFIGWQLWPILASLYLSFTDERFLDNESANWIGLANYRQVLQQELFWQGIKRALIFTAIFIPGMIFIPMIAAILVDRVSNNKVATFYRVVLLIPSMIPAPLIFVLWVWMYDNYIGPINYFLVDRLGWFDLANAPLWLENNVLIYFSIAFMEWWWGLGYHTMFFLAGLASIPRDLPDAARVDGAGEWRMFWGVTIWRLLPIILVLTVVRFGSAMAVITEYIIMQGFTRTSSTYTWTMYMNDEAFRTGQQFRGYAAAIGWLGAIFMLMVVAGLFYLFRSRD